MINNEDNERYDDTYAAQSDPPTTTTTTTPSRFCALPISFPSHATTTNTHHHPAAPRRGGVIFAKESNGNDGGDDGDNDIVTYALQRIKYPESRSKSILKVKSLDDSLNSCFENDGGRSHHEKSWKSLSFGRRQVQQHNRRSNSYLRVVQTFQNLQISNAFTSNKRAGIMVESREPQNEDETEKDVLKEFGEGDDAIVTPMNKTNKTSIDLMARQLQQEQELSTRRGVNFSTVSVRQYHITPDDNPSVSKGPAIGLSWNFDEMPTLTLEQYEELMSEAVAASAAAAANPYRCHAKPMEHLRMTFQERLRLLQDIGTPPREIKRFIRESNLARKQRLRTIAQLKLQDRQVAKKMSKNNKVTKKQTQGGIVQQRQTPCTESLSTTTTTPPTIKSSSSSSSSKHYFKSWKPIVSKTDDDLQDELWDRAQQPGSNNVNQQRQFPWRWLPPYLGQVRR